MKRYIDADAILDEMDKYVEQHFTKLGMIVDGNECFYKVKELLENAPTTDMVEVVRCKDCMNRMKNRFCLEHLVYEKNDMGYCADGIRRE